MYVDEEHGLGLPIAAAAGVIGGLSSLFGGAHPKDKIRYQRNQWLYNDAVGGHKGDLYMLGVMSSKLAAPEDFSYGPLPDAWTGTVKKGTRGGWATGSTRDDAWQKYTGAKVALERSGWQFDGTGLLVNVGVPAPPPPLVTPQAGGVTGPSASTGPTLASVMPVNPMVMAVAIGAAALLAFTQSGRK